MVVMLGWPINERAAACFGDKTPRGIMRCADAGAGTEYFGIEIIGDNHENGANMLDVSERYCALVDILVANNIHIDYKIGRPRIWAINNSI